MSTLNALGQILGGMASEMANQQVINGTTKQTQDHTLDIGDDLKVVIPADQDPMDPQKIYVVGNVWNILGNDRLRSYKKVGTAKKANSLWADDWDTKIQEMVRK